MSNPRQQARKMFQNRVKAIAEKKASSVEKAKVNPRMRLNLALATHNMTASRSLKNESKFGSDEVLERAYAVVSDLITGHKYTPENVYAHMSENYEKTPLDLAGKDIRRAGRYLASMCERATKRARSTSSFAQDLKQLGKLQNRPAIKMAFPAFKDEVLDTVYKATYTPSRTK